MATITLPAEFVARVVLTAKFRHHGGPFEAELRFQGAGFAVDAGVNYVAVIALVTGNVGFLLDEQ